LKDSNIHKVIQILRKESHEWDAPIVTLTAETSHDPFKILISTILSLRTLDTTTAKVSKRLFEIANNPHDMLKLDVKEVEKAIYPVGFYKTKARTILHICREIVEKYDSKVPDGLDELLKLKGVGRKTANLVVTLGYGGPGICVDTHVHRISNRLGYIKTKTPYETEMALREKLPKKYWIEYNDILVAFGQHLCRPISPKCSACPVRKYCDKVGVDRSR
jgi:endonuclease-3